MDEAERLRNADFLQMASHELEQREPIAAREAIYDVVANLHATEYDREANTLLGAAMHTRFRRYDRAQQYVSEVYRRLVEGYSEVEESEPHRKV